MVFDRNISLKKMLILLSIFIASVYVLCSLMSLNMTFVFVQWPPESQDVPSKSVLWIQFVDGLPLWLESYCYLSKVGKALASTNPLSPHSQGPFHPAGFSFSCSLFLSEKPTCITLASQMWPFLWPHAFFPLLLHHPKCYILWGPWISLSLFFPLCLVCGTCHSENMQILFYFGWDYIWMNSNWKRIKYTPNIPQP